MSQLYFYLTEGCNLACRHCWLAPKLDPEGDRYPVLDPADFETAIAEALPLGLSGVKLTGGEPLLHPAFHDLLKMTRKADLALSIETNGTRCDPAAADAIARCRDPFVSVSIDGADAATHDAIRGVRGAFDGATAAVGMLATAGLRPQIILSVMRENARQITDLIRLAERLGAGSVKFNPVQPLARGAALSASGAALSVTELIALGHSVNRELAPRTRLSLLFDFPLAFRPLSRIAGGDGCHVCGIRSILGVVADGHYALCGIGRHEPALVFGQIGADRLDGIWRGHPVLTELRRGLPARLSGVCGRCLMKGRCLGGCVAQNYHQGGHLFAPFWFCREAEAAGCFPDSRLAPHRAERNSHAE